MPCSRPAAVANFWMFPKVAIVYLGNAFHTSLHFRPACRVYMHVFSMIPSQLIQPFTKRNKISRDAKLWQSKATPGSVKTMVTTFFCFGLFFFSDPGVYIFPDILGGCNSSLPNNHVNSVIKKSPFACLVEINLF